MAQPQHLKYQGNTVHHVRDARAGDPGFKEGEDQVMATLHDGTAKMLKRSEIEGLEQKKDQDQGKDQEQDRNRDSQQQRQR